MKSNKRPQVRFSEFSKDWEEHKVGEFLNESRILGTNGLNAKKITVKLWRKGIVPKSEAYQGSEATQYYTRKAGQFIYGKLDFLNQAFGIIPNELDGYESTLDSPSYDIADDLNPFFFLEYVSRKKFYLYQGVQANGSRKAKRIHSETFFDMPLIIPRIEEQNKIGDFFKNLDNMISFQQQELDTLKQTKQGFLQKMFPNEGESVPEIRFPGFIGDWKERELSNMTDSIGTGRSSFIKNGNSADNAYPILGSTSIIGYDSEFDHEGDFILTARVGANAGKLYRYHGQVKITDNTVFIKGENLSFLYPLLKHIDLKKLSYGTGQPLVKASELKKLKIKSPSFDEQNQIGNFFKQLDEVIALQEQELDALKQTKKAFLQKMFV